MQKSLFRPLLRTFLHFLTSGNTSLVISIAKFEFSCKKTQVIFLASNDPRIWECHLISQRIFLNQSWLKQTPQTGILEFKKIGICVYLGFWGVKGARFNISELLGQSWPLLTPFYWSPIVQWWTTNINTSLSWSGLEEQDISLIVLCSNNPLGVQQTI